MSFVNKPIEIISYDKEQYDFAKLILQHFELKNVKLHRLHNLLFPSVTVPTREQDQDNPFTKKFYTIDGVFYSLYYSFIKEVVEPFVGESIIYQRVPNFRVQLPNSVAVGEEHKDSDYGHPFVEINVLVPLTEMRDTAAIFIEGKRIDLMPGQCLVFDGANLRHGNKINITGQTRVSFDFRVIRKREYSPSVKTSINTKTPFAIGGYYAE